MSPCSPTSPAITWISTAHADLRGAKRKLFDWPGLKHAVVNLDDGMGQRLLPLLAERKLPVIGYAIADEQGGDTHGVLMLRASQLRSSHTGTAFHVDCPLGAASQDAAGGRFNISNALGVMGVLLTKGVACAAVVAAAAALSRRPAACSSSAA
jgi:UDP-N-acetylmuramoyl-L-alanyl-D-glutamate--2,6-diaminopimelate ligase